MPAARLVTLLSLLSLLLTGCPGIPPAERLEFATDARILRGSYVGFADTRSYASPVVLSADASVIALGRDRTIEFLGPDHSEPFATIDLSDDPAARLNALAIAGDGSLVAGALDGKAVLWDGATAAPVRTIDPGDRLGACAHCGLRNVELSHDGALLAMVGDAPHVLLADTATGSILHELEMPSDVGTFAAFGAEGALLAAGAVVAREFLSLQYAVRVWDTASATLVFEHQGTVSHDQSPGFAFSADGRSIAVVSGGQLELLDLNGGRTVVPLETLEAFWGVALNRDGTRAAVGLRADYGSDLVILDAATGEELERVESSLVPNATWSDDGRYLLADGQLLDATDFTPVHDFTSGGLHSLEVDFTPAYLDTFRYAVVGTVRIDGGEAIEFSGTVEGNESQRYARPQARLPRPATVRLELRDHPWQLHASQRSVHDRREPGDGYPWTGWVVDTAASQEPSYPRLEFERAP